MTAQHIVFTVFAVVIAIPVIAAIVLTFRTDSRRSREYEFARGYREGWRDCRDGNPPKDFP